MRGVKNRHAMFSSLDFDSPRADQPPKIILPLWPHQKAVLHAAARMESGEIFELTPTTKIRTRIGYLNDPIGSGKTLTMLGIIAQTPVENIYKRDGQVLDTSYSTKWVKEIPDCKLKTTLIIVNNQIVFEQWYNMILKCTELKLLAIDRKKDYDFIERDKIISSLNNMDVVLIKKTLIKNFLNYYKTTDFSLTYWERVVFDEAHESTKYLNTVSANFMWLVSGSYVSYDNSEHFRIRSNADFCNFSTNIIDITVREYVCEREDRQVYIIKDMLSPEVMAHINAGDFKGAIRRISGNEDADFNETNVIKALTTKFEKDLKDVELTINYTREVTMLEHARKEALEKLEKQKSELKAKIETIRTRVTSLRDEKCSICLDDEPKNKIVINPCLHVACSECMVQYINFSKSKRQPITCQMCRTKVNIAGMRIIDVNAPSTSAAPHAPPAVVPAPARLVKLDQAISIVRKRQRESPDAKILIFAQYNANFYKISLKIKRSMILQGDAPTISKIVSGFKQGSTQVLIIDSRHYAAGMNLQEATDVILMQNLGENEAQCIGRAQRPGRTTSLRVHRLVYQDE